MNWQIKQILYRLNDALNELANAGHLNCIAAGAWVTGFFVFAILPGYDLATALSLVFAVLNFMQAKEAWDQFRWKV